MLTTMDPAELARAWRRRDAEEAASAVATSAALRERAIRAAASLVERFGVGRVILFGSVVRGAATDSSDVDLAVEGLPPCRQFAAMADAEAVIGRPVDLVRIEEATPTLLGRIVEDGEVLFDGGPPAP